MELVLKHKRFKICLVIIYKIVDEIRSDQNLEKQVDRSIFEKKIADLESQAINSFRKLSQKTAESLESGSETGEAG